MPSSSDIWSTLLTLPNVVATLIVGVVIAVVTFALNRLAKRLDDRAADRRQRPSRSNERAGQRFRRGLATRPRAVRGPARWALTFNASLQVYEIEQHGPDVVHNLRIDFFEAHMGRQQLSAPTIQVAQLPPGLPVTMPLGAPSRQQRRGVALRWDDSFGIDQFERFRLADARIS